MIEDKIYSSPELKKLHWSKTTFFIFKFFFLLSIFSFFSCSFQKKVIIGKPENVQIISFVDDTIVLTALLPVENNSSRDIIIKTSEFDILADSFPIGKAMQLHPVTIEKENKKNYEITFRAYLFKDVDLVSFGLKSLFGKQPDLLLAGTATVKSGIIRKRIKINISLNDYWKQIRRLLR